VKTANRFNDLFSWAQQGSNLRLLPCEGGWASFRQLPPTSFGFHPLCFRAVSRSRLGQGFRRGPSESTKRDTNRAQPGRGA
jgi:hypothetical protein